MPAQSEIILHIDGIDPILFYGENNKKINVIKNAFPDVTITARGEQLKISGAKKDTQNVKDKIEWMIRILKEQKELSVQSIEDLLAGNNPFESQLSSNGTNPIILYGKDGAPIRVKTHNQKLLLTAVEKNDIVFAIGPAGTGKTYTAVALAVRALKNRVIKKIILTRPAVEAGESLGFLPGDLKEKIDPYLRPLYDALDDMIAPDKLLQFQQNRIIEIAPLAYMRGRTLDHCYIILDEAQNATSLQIKMFLTRLGPSAKCIITGDLSQIDLPGHQRSGLKHAVHLLENVDGIATVYLDENDVVRHRLVKEIIKAYGRSDQKRREEREKLRNEPENHDEF